MSTAWDLSCRSRKRRELNEFAQTETTTSQFDNDNSILTNNNEVFARFLAAAAMARRLLPIKNNNIKNETQLISATNKRLEQQVEYIFSNGQQKPRQCLEQQQQQQQHTTSGPNSPTSSSSSGSGGCFYSGLSTSSSLSDISSTSLSSSCLPSPTCKSPTLFQTNLNQFTQQQQLLLFNYNSLDQRQFAYDEYDGTEEGEEEDEGEGEGEEDRGSISMVADSLDDNNSTCDRRARKKDQNRRAAFNYRRKKMEERDRMIEEEAKLVHKHVRLTGKIAHLEKRILTILNTKTRKILDNNGIPLWYLCPICLRTYDNILNLRIHFKLEHFPNSSAPTKSIKQQQNRINCTNDKQSQQVEINTSVSGGKQMSNNVNVNLNGDSGPSEMEQSITSSSDTDDSNSIVDGDDDDVSLNKDLNINNFCYNNAHN